MRIRWRMHPAVLLLFLACDSGHEVAGHSFYLHSVAVALWTGSDTSMTQDVPTDSVDAVLVFGPLRGALLDGELTVRWPAERHAQTYAVSGNRDSNGRVVLRMSSGDQKIEVAGELGGRELRFYPDPIDDWATVNLVTRVGFLDTLVFWRTRPDAVHIIFQRRAPPSRASVSLARVDVRMLALAMEVAFVDLGRYPSRVPSTYSPPGGSEVKVIYAGPVGYGIEAHNGATHCTVWVGTRSPDSGKEGEPVCTGD
jgi:hypothetical protein